jgi:hypothetical protein
MAWKSQGGESAGAPPTLSGSGSYTRFSSENQDELSTHGQQRKCRMRALRDGNSISPQLEFRDEAVSGAKRSRTGLDAMLVAARAGILKCLYVESLSRLARDCVLTLQILKELVFKFGVRIVSIDDGIDTSNCPNWELLAAVLGIQNEQCLKNLSLQVFRGQEELILTGFALNDYCFGYGVEVIEGADVPKAGGREPRHRYRYVVDKGEAEWVIKIFRWFVVERQSIRWIVRELNRLCAPKDHRATTTTWRHQYLTGRHGLLKNRKYIGYWSWGRNKNVRDPTTGDIHQQERSPAEIEQWTRHFPDLQIIDSGTFEKAQELLAINAANSGRRRRQDGKLCGSLPRAADDRPRHLLAGVIVCGNCRRRFNVSGANGKYLSCPGYQMGDCTCQTQLRRELAESLILDAIAVRVLSNSGWADELYRLTIQAHERLQRECPQELQLAEQALADVEQRLARLLDNCETGLVPELRSRVEQRRAERDSLCAKIDKLRRDLTEARTKITPDWIAAQLSDLRSLLLNRVPAAAHSLRKLVGGAIVVHEVRKSESQRFHLEGVLNLHLTALSEAIGCDKSVIKQSQNCETVVIEFRNPHRYELLSNDVKHLWDEGSTERQIRELLCCSRTLIDRALQFWHDSRGLDRPDGRGCRARLKGRRKADQLRDEIIGQYYQDIPVLKIAESFGCCPEIVREAIEKWHIEHGLEVLDGRTRRRQIRLKSSAYKAIASKKLADSHVS